MDYESTLLIVREVTVYKIPPRTNARGYRAADWSTCPVLWTGRLRVTAMGDQAFIKLEDPKTGEIFGVCNYDPNANCVEPVLDSSRYFVVRLEDNGRFAFVGMGFQERSEAFDFNVALQDHVKHVKAATEPVKKVETGPKADYSLKEGETISIKIGTKTTKAVHKPNESTDAGAVPFLPPPPNAARHTRTGAQPADGGFAAFSSAPSSASKAQEDDWGDFSSFGSK